MTEREKIVEIVLDNEITGIKLRNITGGMSTANAIADALIAANIGDVTEWKERAEKHRFMALPDGRIKQLYSDKEVEQIVKERDEYKHRAEVAERAFDNTIKAFHETLSALFPDTKVDLDEWKKNNLANAEKELAEEK